MGQNLSATNDDYDNSDTLHWNTIDTKTNNNDKFMSNDNIHSLINKMNKMNKMNNTSDNTSNNFMSDMNNNNISATSIDNNTSNNNMTEINNNKNMSATSFNNDTSEITNSQINNVILSDTSADIINGGNLSSEKLSEFNNVFKGGNIFNDIDKDLFSDSSSSSSDEDTWIGSIKSESNNYEFSKSTTDFLLNNNSKDTIQSSFSGYSLNGIDSDNDSDSDSDNEKLTYSLSSLNINNNELEAENSDTYNINFEDSDSEVSTFNTSDIDVVSVNSGKRFL